MSWSCVEAPWSLQEGNEQAVVQGDLPLSKKQSPDGQGESPQLTEGLQNWNSVCQHSPVLVQRGGRVVRWVPASFVVCVPML